MRVVWVTRPQDRLLVLRRQGARRGRRHQLGALVVVLLGCQVRGGRRRWLRRGRLPRRGVRRLLQELLRGRPGLRVLVLGQVLVVGRGALGRRPWRPLLRGRRLRLTVAALLRPLFLLLLLACMAGQPGGTQRHFC